MVSFCDLPISLIKSHLKFYGYYGIGLTKNWGISNGVTPVFYVHNNSMTFQPSLELMSWGLKLLTMEGYKIYKEWAQIIMYTKPYEGNAWRKDKNIKNIRFYDEREWRYVPILDSPNKYLIEKKRYLISHKVKVANARLAKQFILRIKPDDIQYIVVAKEKDILPMIRHIEIIKGKYSADEVKILTTKILSAERIFEDF
jgi:hypothetical protein